MPGYLQETITDGELERERQLYGPLTEAVRALVDATIRSTVDDHEIRAIRAEVESLTARLRASELSGPYGVRFNTGGRARAWGNVVVGLRNACAPPVAVVRDESRYGAVSAHFDLGAAYEGPPGLVHGGAAAMVLDHMLGEAAGAGGKPGMTGTLTIVYRRGTPLGPLRAEAWIDRVEGIKTYAKGHLKDAEGVTVEAEGVFILPKWAREAQSTSTPTPATFE